MFLSLFCCDFLHLMLQGIFILMEYEYSLPRPEKTGRISNAIAKEQRLVPRIHSSLDVKKNAGNLPWSLQRPQRTEFLQRDNRWTEIKIQAARLTLRKQKASDIHANIGTQRVSQAVDLDLSARLEASP